MCQLNESLVRVVRSPLPPERRPDRWRWLLLPKSHLVTDQPPRTPVKMSQAKTQQVHVSVKRAIPPRRSVSAKEPRAQRTTTLGLRPRVQVASPYLLRYVSGRVRTLQVTFSSQDAVSTSQLPRPAHLSGRRLGVRPFPPCPAPTPSTRATVLNPARCSHARPIFRVERVRDDAVETSRLGLLGRRAQQLGRRIEPQRHRHRSIEAKPVHLYDLVGIDHPGHRAPDHGYADQ